MKYGIVSITPKPFIIPILPIGIFIEGKLLTTIFTYPHPNKPNQYPLMIDWKYRLHNNGHHLFTYMAETKFIIKDDGEPVDNSQIEKFIGDLYINVEIGWENQTRNTPLHGTTLPAMVGENLNCVKEQILDAMK